MPLSEFSIIESFFDRATSGARGDVSIGIGDDAAVLRVPDGYELVTTIDTLVVGVHFPENTPAAALGHKALAVNLSDLAAMGANPAWVTLSLTLPAPDENWLQDFASGFFALADACDVGLVGGDTSRGPLSVSVQAHGLVPRGHSLLRRGAAAGDRVYVSGALGDAGLGLRIAMNQIPGTAEGSGQLLRCLQYPTPRIALGQALRGIASACIDVSDGLLADLGHILRASDVGAEVCVDYLPRSVAFNAVASPGSVDWHELPLNAGDDYELCFCVPPEKEEQLVQVAKSLNVRVTPIGEITRKLELTCFHDDGEPYAISATGYQHF